jgi:hypothetical protein
LFVRTPGAERLIIHFHGKLGNISRRLRELECLAERGANVLGVSYRGSGASSGRPLEAGATL